MRHATGHTITIAGKRLNIHYARLVYRCEVCHSNLERHNAGLKCVANHDHRGFIHRNEATQIQATQQANVNTLKDFYVVKDGKVELKCQS